MINACKIIADAPNGQPSNLFKDLLGKYDRLTTKKLYEFLTKPEFQESYQGGKDTNEEPLLKDFLENEYVRKNFPYQNRLNKIHKQVTDQLRTKISRLERSTSDRTQEYVKTLSDLENKLDSFQLAQGINEYVLNGREYLAKASANLVKEVNDKTLKSKDLELLRQFTKSYKVLDELKKELEKNKRNPVYDLDLQDLAIIEEDLNGAIADRDFIEGMLDDLTLETVPEFLDQFNENPNLSVEQIKDQLELVRGDTSFMGRWVNALSDANDNILQLFAKAVKTKKTEGKFLTNDFRKGWLDSIEKLENYWRSQGKDAGNPEQVYGIFMEKDKEGNLTGNTVRIYTHEYYQLLKEQQKLTSDMDEAERRKSWKAWFKEHYSNKQPKSKYFSKEYKYIQSVPELKQFLSDYTSSYAKLQSNIPTKFRNRGRIPTVYKSSLEGFLRDGISKDAAKNLWKEIWSTEREYNRYGEVDENGELVNFLPIAFSNKNMDPKEMSLDLGKSLQLYAQMSYDYKVMSDIVYDLENVKSLVEKRKVIKKNRNPFKRTSVEQTTTGSDTNSFQQLKDYMEMVVYGQDKAEEEYLFINDKMIDKINAIGSIKSLALNVFSGISNKVTGEVLQATEAIGRQFYTPSDYAFATKEYNSNMGGILSDIGKRKKENKINLLNEYFGTLKSFGTTLEDNSRVKNLLKTDSLFFMQEIGEHTIQSKLMLALMNGYIVTKNGKEIVNPNTNKPYTLYEAFTVKDGELVKSIDFDWTLKDRVKFSNRMLKINQRMHGIYNQEDKNAIQKHSMGRAMMTFRKWIVPGVLRRFQFEVGEGGKLEAVFNQELGEYTKGSYISFGQYTFSKQFIQDLVKLKWFMSDSNWSKLSDLDKQNIRKTIAEAAFATIALVIGRLLYGLSRDEDEDSKTRKTLSFLAYQADRLNGELIFYVNPSELAFGANSILRTPASSVTMLEDTLQLAWQVLIPFDLEKNGELDFSWDDRYEKGFRKDRLKIVKETEDILPIVGQIQRLYDVGDINLR